MSELVVGWLYPDHLSVYGDRGNVIALQRRLAWRGIAARTILLGRGAAPELDDVDVLFVGGGQDLEQERIYDDFLATKAERLRALVEQDLVVLAVCAGFQLLGNRYVTPSGATLPGAAILDVDSHSDGRRFVGDVVVDAQLPGLEGKTIVGFENHGGRTTLGAIPPVGRVRAGYGNNGKDATEGAWRRNVVGTYLHGALLPRNPHLADLLLARAAARRGLEPLGPLDDGDERAAHEYVVRHASRHRIVS